MKLLIASDLHGSAFFCRELLRRFEEEKAEKIIFLGDILYHGPRNALPEEYSPKNVAQMLNSVGDKMVCVRGNCDSEVDGMVLNFPIFTEYGMLLLNGRRVWITHGHNYSYTNPLPCSKGDILLHGHTHVPANEDIEVCRYLNPGSLSVPKENSPNSYMIYDDGVFLWKKLDSGESYDEFTI